MLIFARSYGLTGFVRISVKKHVVIESKPDHFLDDLRLNNPWHELRRLGYPCYKQKKKRKKKEGKHETWCHFLQQLLQTSLNEFITNEGGGEAPLEGSILEMTSSTEQYVTLQKIYQAKAESDFHVIEQRVRNILKRMGRDPDSISKASIQSFCKNARKLKVWRYRLIEDEFSSPILPELKNSQPWGKYLVIVNSVDAHITHL